MRRSESRKPNQYWCLLAKDTLIIEGHSKIDATQLKAKSHQPANAPRYGFFWLPACLILNSFSAASFCTNFFITKSFVSG